MQTFTAHSNKAVWPTYHILKTIIMLLPESMGTLPEAPSLGMPQHSS